MDVYLNNIFHYKFFINSINKLQGKSMISQVFLSIAQKYEAHFCAINVCICFGVGPSSPEGKVVGRKVLIRSKYL